MIKTIRVMLLPNNKQRTKLFQYANTARFAYNWTLSREQENDKNGGKFISDSDLRKEFTDACDAYHKFFKGYTKQPKFKSKKHTVPSFYQDNIKIKFTDTHVKIEGFSTSKKKNKQKLNWIRLAEHDRIPNDGKYINPRIKFDGLNWYLTVGMEYEDSVSFPVKEGIRIDLGIKELAICSDEKTYQNINKTQKVKRLEKRKRRLQRFISRRYEKNKKGESYCKTSNIIKSEKKLLRLHHRLTNIRQNYLHQTTSEIIKREPSFKLCSCCGTVKKDLKLSERIYRCKCGNVIDRDYQAALNLKRYGEMSLQSVI